MTKASITAGKEAYDAAVGEFAGALARYSNLLPTLYPGLKMPPVNEANEAEYRRIARELLDKKRANVNGTIISIDESDPNSLDALDSKNGGMFKKALGVDNLNKLGSKDGLVAFSGAIENAVAKNSSDIGFLKGASIGNALSGLMRWLMSGLKGGLKGLIEQIGMVTAQNIHSDVTSNLQRLRGERPDMASMLTDENIRKSADGAYYAALGKAGIASANAPPKQKFGDITPISVDDAKLNDVRRQVYVRVMNPKGGESLGDTLGETLIETRNGSLLGLGSWGGAIGITEEKLRNGGKRMADVIATTLSNEATDKANAARLADMPREDYSNYMADKVRNAVKEQEGRINLPINLTEERLSMLREKVRVSVLENYDQLSLSTRVAAASQIDQRTGARAVAAAEEARNAGMGGATDAKVILAQAGGKKPSASGGRQGQGAGSAPNG